MISFGKRLGRYESSYFKADNHCDLFVDGVVMGKIFKVTNGYEYRGEPIGLDGLEWVARSDQRDLIDALEASLKAVKKRKPRKPRKPRRRQRKNLMIDQG